MAATEIVHAVDTVSQSAEASELVLLVRRWIKAELAYAGTAAVAALASQTADNIQMRFDAFRTQQATS